MRFDVTEKEDGLNMAMYCSRLQDPKRPIHLCIGGQEVRFSDRSYFWRMVLALGVAERLLDSGRNLVLDGVVVGPGFRHYEDGYRRDDFRVFDVFDLDEDRTMTPGERREFCTAHDMPMVRDLLTDAPIFADFPTMDGLTAGLASGRTARGLPRHGIVARSRDPSAPAWFDVANPGYAAFLRGCGG